jgi:hypothetical protein
MRGLIALVARRTLAIMAGLLIAGLVLVGVAAL